MRVFHALLFLFVPVAAAAGIVFEIELTDAAETSTTEVYMEGKNLKMSVFSSDGTPNKDIVLIRRADGETTVIFVDHQGRVYGQGDLQPGSPGLSLMPTGRIAMAPGGIKLHVGGGPSDIWIQTGDTGNVGEVLQWMTVLHRAIDSIAEDLPDSFEGDGGIFDGEFTLIDRGQRRIDPVDFEPPSGYKRRSMFVPEQVNSDTTTAGATAPTNASGGAVSATMSGEAAASE